MSLKVITADVPDEAMARAKTVCNTLDFSKSTLHRKVADGSFPKPYQLFEGVVGWRVGDIRSWLQSRTQTSSLANQPKELAK